jgi:hypothetical protein
VKIVFLARDRVHDFVRKVWAGSIYIIFEKGFGSLLRDFFNFFFLRFTGKSQ